jgi:hypothetical protein
MRKPQMIFGIMALSLASTSCLRQQRTQARVFTPPPVRPRIVPEGPAAPEGPSSLPDPPRIGGDLASLSPPQLPETTPDNVEVPEAPKRVARRPAPVVTPARPPSTGPVTPEPVAPRLAQMFTPEEQRENNKVLDESLERVNRALAVVEGKNLSAPQKEIAERIRTFRKQAEQVREQDLLTAVSLARRADLLAKDLLEHLP